MGIGHSTTSYNSAKYEEFTYAKLFCGMAIPCVRSRYALNVEYKINDWFRTYIYIYILYIIYKNYQYNKDEILI